MALSVALQMDPLGGINPHSDSTLLLGIEAQRRGHTLYYYAPQDISWRDGIVTARAQPVTLYTDPKRHYELGEALTLDLGTLDVILLRQDPPFDMGYVTNTHILERLHPRPLVVNNPASVRNCPEKLFPTVFRQFMPPTLISSDIDEIARFRAHHGDIILKPLYGFGGHAVLRIKPDDDNFSALLEMTFLNSKEPLMAQPFLPEVKSGERRIIMIDGEIGGVLGRIPAEHEIRANLRVGGTPVTAELTPKQREICEVLGPVLKDKGLIFAGVDVIGDYLTEINITSPTGIAPINRLYGVKLESMVWDAIEARL